MGISLAKDEKQLTNEVMGKISLSKDKVNLEKHVISLSKTIVDISKKSNIDLTSLQSKVVVALDFSGSMTSLYERGTVQETLNKLVPLGLKFDDNGNVDVFLFQNTYKRMPSMTLDNYENYVKSVILKSGYDMRGTEYSPVLNAIIYGETKHGLFRTKHVNGIVDDTCPTFVLFITDGENSDSTQTDDIIRKCSGENVFIQFIGIGRTEFRYLKSLDDMEDRIRDNTGFSQMSSLENVSDEILYTNVFEQFSQWLKGEQ